MLLVKFPNFHSLALWTKWNSNCVMWHVMTVSYSPKILMTHLSHCLLNAVLLSHQKQSVINGSRTSNCNKDIPFSPWKKICVQKCYQCFKSLVKSHMEPIAHSTQSCLNLWYCYWAAWTQNTSPQAYMLATTLDFSIVPGVCCLSLSFFIHNTSLQLKQWQATGWRTRGSVFSSFLFSKKRRLQKRHRAA